MPVPVRRDGTWWRGFHGPLPQRIEQLTASGHVFAITEIVVHPHEMAGRQEDGAVRVVPT
ncbi:hypothetical protein [Streptomyces sp. NBC_00212]|uniref:hypothetical protein n=1 Tax=Streptomyces sp. NBC_00212 TaxID=2975684 RepID=UPI0032491C32